MDVWKSINRWEKLVPGTNWGYERVKCCFAGPKGNKGGECWLEERWTVTTANEKTTHVDRYYKCPVKMLLGVGPL